MDASVIHGYDLTMQTKCRTNQCLVFFSNTLSHKVPFSAYTLPLVVFYVSRHVTFDETVFPFKSKKPLSPAPNTTDEPPYIPLPPVTVIRTSSIPQNQPPFVQPTGTTSLIPPLQVQDNSTGTLSTPAPPTAAPELSPPTSTVQPQQPLTSSEPAPLQQTQDATTTNSSVSASDNADPPPNQRRMVTRRQKPDSQAQSQIQLHCCTIIYYPDGTSYS